jgi:hypothetical protein
LPISVDFFRKTFGWAFVVLSMQWCEEHSVPWLGGRIYVRQSAHFQGMIGFPLYGACASETPTNWRKWQHSRHHKSEVPCTEIMDPVQGHGGVFSITKSLGTLQRANISESIFSFSIWLKLQTSASFPCVLPNLRRRPFAHCFTSQRSQPTESQHQGGCESPSMHSSPFGGIAFLPPSAVKSSNASCLALLLCNACIDQIWIAGVNVVKCDRIGAAVAI